MWDLQQYYLSIYSFIVETNQMEHVLWKAGGQQYKYPKICDTKATTLHDAKIHRPALNYNRIITNGVQIFYIHADEMKKKTLVKPVKRITCEL